MLCGLGWFGYCVCGLVTWCGMLCLITYDWGAGCGYGCYFCRVVIVIFGLRELVLLCRVVNGWCLLDRFVW